MVKGKSGGKGSILNEEKVENTLKCMSFFPLNYISANVNHFNSGKEGAYYLASLRFQILSYI